MENSFLQLRNVRKELGLSLNDVAQKLKIQRSYLTYIEEGKWDRLPEDVYAIGFIRNYAKFVGVKSDDIVNQFKMSRMAEEEVPEEGTNQKITRTSNSDNSESEFEKAAQELFDKLKTQRTLQIAAVTVMIILLFGILHVFGYAA